MAEYVNRLSDQAKENLEASRGRNRLARSVIRYNTGLLRCTPEAKGVLLYLLMRSGKWDWADTENWSSGRFGVDIYAERKAAVLEVLKSIQSKPEWSQILCRINEDGQCSATANKKTVARENRARLIRFLGHGDPRKAEFRSLEREKTVAEFISSSRYALGLMVSMERRLKVEGYRGFALSMNDSIFYAMTGFDNLSCVGDFGPCAVVV